MRAVAGQSDRELEARAGGCAGHAAPDAHRGRDNHSDKLKIDAANLLTRAHGDGQSVVAVESVAVEDGERDPNGRVRAEVAVQRRAGAAGLHEVAAGLEIGKAVFAGFVGGGAFEHGPPAPSGLIGELMEPDLGVGGGFAVVVDHHARDDAVRGQAERGIRDSGAGGELDGAGAPLQEAGPGGGEAVGAGGQAGELKPAFRTGLGGKAEVRVDEADGGFTKGSGGEGVEDVAGDDAGAGLGLGGKRARGKDGGQESGSHRIQCSGMEVGVGGAEIRRIPLSGWS